MILSTPQGGCQPGVATKEPHPRSDKEASENEMSILTSDQEEFLRANNLAALATGRQDGSPQLSHIVYDWDGSNILISIKSNTAKCHNAQRQPRVALLVHDGRKQLVIYGVAEPVSDDPERIELTARVFRRVTGNSDIEVNDGFVAGMNAQKRTILRIRPEKATMND
jgi:PPOX class probable F420-dependent enzyme